MVANGGGQSTEEEGQEQKDFINFRYYWYPNSEPVLGSGSGSYVFCPPGSGSRSTRYVSESLKNNVNVASKSNKLKILVKK
jgi:hypothetical protein